MKKNYIENEILNAMSIDEFNKSIEKAEEDSSLGKLTEINILLKKLTLGLNQILNIQNH